MGYSRRGFTLMEIVLVMAVLVIIGALAVPVISSMFAAHGLDAAADTVQAQLTKARNKAVEQRIPYKFAIKEGTGMFRIAPDSDEYWGEGGSAECVAGDGPAGEAPLVFEGSLPEKVCFCPPDGIQMGIGGGQGWTHVATFLADGTAIEDVYIGLTMEGNDNPKIIQLKGGTGSITTASLPAPGYAH